MGVKPGKLYAFVGTMGAGKSKKLCSLYHKLTDEGKTVVVFKHINDAKRGGHKDKIVTRSGDSVPAISIECLSEILHYQINTLFDVVMIDEIQFFEGSTTIEVIEGALLAGVDVYVFGLDVTSEFKPFGLMGHILARADEVKKLKCKCRKCGEDARVSAYFGVEDKEGDVKVGDIGEYVPLCRKCYYDEFAQLEPYTDHQDDFDDKFYEFSLNLDGVRFELGVYESELKLAGYTAEQVQDINSEIGIRNLLEDLGYTRE